MPQKIFIDTWGWIALFDSREERHNEVKLLYSRLRNEQWQVVTTDYVLDELVTLLFRKLSYEEALFPIEMLLESVEKGYITLESVSREKFASAWSLRKIYSDKPDISFTDLTSFVVMKEKSISEVLTADKHFTKVNLDFNVLP